MREIGEELRACCNELGALVALEMGKILQEGVGEVQETPFLVRCRLHGEAASSLTLFADGRLIVTGTTDGDIARSLYARYVGS